MCCSLILLKRKAIKYHKAFRKLNCHLRICISFCISPTMNILLCIVKTNWIGVIFPFPNAKSNFFNYLDNFLNAWSSKKRKTCSLGAFMSFFPIWKRGIGSLLECSRFNNDNLVFWTTHPTLYSVANLGKIFQFGQMGKL